MIASQNLPTEQSKCTVLQRLRNTFSAVARVKLLTTAVFITVITAAGLAWANHPICDRSFALMNKVVDLTDQFHLIYGDLKIDFIARPGSSKHPAGNRDP